MSFDLHVFGADDPSLERLAESVSTVDGTRCNPAGHEILRPVRGREMHLASFDGPHRVEPEDLPPAVLAAAPGIATLLELHCPFTPATGIALTKRIARALAKAASGVVYDPQEDRVTWPRGSTRKFTVPKVRQIEVVDLAWFVRREDRPDDLPEVVIDTIRSILPEALPRRFGGCEPLPFRLDEEGQEGFAREWRSERLMLYWSTRLPSLGGSMVELGAEGFGKPPPVPMGTVSLSLHRSVLSDRRWRRDVRRLFLALAERTNAFFALADVDRNVSYGGGHLSYGPDAETAPSLLYGGKWMGLPGHEFWLAWLGSGYRDVLPAKLLGRPEVEEAAGGLLVTTGEEPPDRPEKPDFRRPWFRSFPPDLAMTRNTQVDEHHWRGWKPQRAVRVPDGL